MEMQTGGPAAMSKYANDPEIMGLVAKIQVRALYQKTPLFLQCFISPTDLYRRAGVLT